MFVLEELGMLEIFNLKNTELSNYFTNDPDVMRYRMEAFDDMLNNPIISNMNIINLWQPINHSIIIYT